MNLYLKNGANVRLSMQFSEFFPIATIFLHFTEI